MNVALHEVLLLVKSVVLYEYLFYIYTSAFNDMYFKSDHFLNHELRYLYLELPTCHLKGDFPDERC